jgi:hypothetical protein
VVIEKEERRKVREEGAKGRRGKEVGENVAEAVKKIKSRVSLQY